MRTRAMVSVAVAAGVVLMASACGPDQAKEDKADTKPSRPSASTPAKEPSASAPAKKPPAAPTGDRPAPRTKEGAIQRYEQYLRAVGREDIDTVCEVAGPAAKQAQDDGFGPCTSTFLITFQMISPAQKEALRSATVDPQGVAVLTPDKVEIPTDAIKASVTFSESELGSSTLEFIKDDWYITD